MNKFYILLIISVFTLSSTLLSQQPEKIEMSNNGTPRLIQFARSNLKSAKTTKAAEKAEVNQLFRTYLKPGTNDELKVANTEKDDLGYTLTNYQQYFKGVKVEHGQYKVHSKDGAVQSIHGDFKKIDAGLQVTPTLTEKQALAKALAHIGAKRYMWEDASEELWAKTNEKSGTFYPNGELVIVEKNGVSDNGKSNAALAYKFNVYAKEPVSRTNIYVEAQTGEIVLVDQIIKNISTTGTVATRYSGIKTITTDLGYRLYDRSRGNGIFIYNLKNGYDYSKPFDFIDDDNNWTAAEYHNTAKDDAALEAAWAFQMIYDYWKNTFNRNSFDNNGAASKAYVHYGIGFDNAYWDGTTFTFGDGSDIKYDAMTSLDICAHEYGHAICQHSANLVYQNESGALNEGLSDIWAATIENYGAPNKKNWIIGEEVERRSGHQGLRVLSNPEAEGYPDTYNGNNWYSGGTWDNGGVHTNSGPLGYWFYLIAAGGHGTNDNGKIYNIQGLGMDKAAKIVWRTESAYLTSCSNYSDFRVYAIQATLDLFGADSNEVIQVTNAFAAIGVGNEYVTYCTPAVTAPKQWISLVKIGSINNASSKNTGYDDYTSMYTDMITASQQTIRLTTGWASDSSKWKVWIDFNHDGDFTDPGEEVINNHFGGSDITATFTVPSIAQAAPTRMRVMLIYGDELPGAPSTPCSLYYGEIEDYTANIKSAIPVTGVTLSSSSLTMTVGQTATLTAVISPSNATNQAVTWTSSDTAVATVNTTGEVTAVTAGTAIITVITADGNKRATCKVSSYCRPPNAGAEHGYISRVKLNTIDNTSGASDYTDFSAIATDLTISSTYTVTIYPAWPDTIVEEGYAVWIDFNDDKDFDDPGELVFNQASSSSTNVSGTFTVPSGTSIGPRRLRVLMNRNQGNILTPCGSSSIGEVEDYTVNIKNPYIPVTSVTLSSSSLTMTSGQTATLTAAVSPSNATNQKVIWTSSNENVAQVNSNGVVKAVNAGTAIITVTTSDGHKTAACTVSSYCASRGVPGCGYISRVKLNTIDNASKATRFTDFSAISTDLAIGNTYHITIYTDWTDTIVEETYGVWIDFNDNKIFDDPSELILSQTSLDTNVSGTFIIPSGTSIGTKRMRICLRYYIGQSTIAPCSSVGFGETEDYTVNITTSSLAPSVAPSEAASENTAIDKNGQENLSSITIYPNPACNTISFKIDEGSISSAKILDIQGNEILKWNYPTGMDMNISNLAKGMYILVVKTDKGDRKKIFVKQ